MEFFRCLETAEINIRKSEYKLSGEYENHSYFGKLVYLERTYMFIRDVVTLFFKQLPLQLIFLLSFYV